VTIPPPYIARNRVTALLQEGGLEMHYQPIVGLKSGNVIKVEALARLRDGNLSPDAGRVLARPVR
jgi:sensor c-di-GMP phosphodiesterase-like protein